MNWNKVDVIKKKKIFLMNNIAHLDLTAVIFRL